MLTMSLIPKCELCLDVAQMAARAVGRRSSSLDGQLFLTKQLLILREQIAPFEADFSVVEKDLDFTHMRDHMRRILAGRSSILHGLHERPFQHRYEDSDRGVVRLCTVCRSSFAICAVIRECHGAVHEPWRAKGSRKSGLSHNLIHKEPSLSNFCSKMAQGTPPGCCGMQ